MCCPYVTIWGRANGGMRLLGTRKECILNVILSHHGQPILSSHQLLQIKCYVSVLLLVISVMYEDGALYIVVSFTNKLEYKSLHAHVDFWHVLQGNIQFCFNREIQLTCRSVISYQVYYYRNMMQLTFLFFI